uniref:Pherophorin domain-containing protein n=1 Tax=Guillardia theta TaxID=55529 RepID=A0A7S4PLD0_GUITH|mmetsp:Transcript_5888/g.20801  ORF Transcript_5888/g.20801 Transcript_5888/m.20801 type:complete len:244 (+) Transcript_5888:290-1021(+)
MLCKSMLWCCLFFVLGTKRVCTFTGYKGYDKEETATGIFKGYCIPMSYNYEIGLCQGYSGTAKVCAATSKADNQFSAEYYKTNEVMSSTSAIMDKTLVKGGTFFKQLALYMITKACSQIGPNVQVNGNLNDDQIQKGACNFVWRRDQEIQNASISNTPAKNQSWGTFLYQGPRNLTYFVFKGIPKSQCSYDYDCRHFNQPGQVYTCCDYCEHYFSTYCDAKPYEIFKFCMEKVSHLHAAFPQC